MSAWKPGDVAVVTPTEGGRPEVALRADYEGVGHVWWTACGYWRDKYVSEVRPLVVIDPEDAEAVGRLVRLLDATADGYVSPHGVLAALREFANPKPPKPDEPAGRFAVVRDAYGREWVRGHDGRWHFGSDKGKQPYSDWISRDWSRVGAIEVLSEGVTA